MSEVTLLCFLQGIEEPFNVTVDKTDTIALLKKIILLRKRGNNHDNVKIWKVSIPADNIASLQKVLPEATNFIELDDEKLVSNAVKFTMMGVIQVYVGEVLKKIPSLNDEIRELKALVRDLAQEQAQKQDQMREDIQRLTDRFESLNTDDGNTLDTDLPTVNTIVFLREEIKKMYDTHKGVLVQKDLVDEANHKLGDKSISPETFSHFISGKSNLHGAGNREAMIYIYNLLKKIDSHAKNS